MRDMDELKGISEESFKQGMRQFAAAVNVITVKYDDIQDGLTATAVWGKVPSLILRSAQN